MSLTYDELCTTHRWDVPPRYNIAADVCDKHPRESPRWSGRASTARPRARLGRAAGSGEPGRAHARRPGVERATGRGRPAADARDRRDLLRRLEARRDPALDVGPLRRRRDRPSALGLGASARWSPTPPTRPASTVRGRRSCRARRADTLAGAPTDPSRRHRGRDPAQLYYTSGTTGLAKGIVHAHRYILGHEEFLYCHEVSPASASTVWASGPGQPGSRRCSGPGGSARCSASTGARPASIPHRQLDFLSRNGSRTCSRRRRRCAR